MWQIVINGPGYFDTTYDLPEGVTHLGRAEENDIVLSGDLVSRRHARFTVSGDTLVVEDLGSRNGSRVNGEPLHGSVALKPGDSVTIGENTLAVRQPSTVETAATEMIDLGAGGVRRFGRGSDIGGAVLVSRDVRESVVMRALDNVLPFESAALGQGHPPFDEAAKTVSYEWLLALYKVAEKLSSARTLQEFLDEALDRIIERAHARTAVVLLQHSSGVMVPAAVRHRGKLARGEIPVSDAIVDAALEKGAALAVADVREDRRFAARESVLLYGADQVLAIPFKIDGTSVGVLYINRSSRETEQLNHLLDLCTALANLVASGVQRFKRGGGAPEDRLKKSLERFHAPEIAERRALDLRKQGRLTLVEEKLCTVLFADLAGFSALTQKVPAARVMEMLNEFYQRMAGIVFSFEGTVVKFIGDAVMAIFGAPYAKGDESLRAVRCALAMRSEWERAMNRSPPGQRCFLRIGMNTGKVLAGTVGSEAHLDFTAVGEPVNVASWLCATAMPGQILMTGKTLAAVGARFDVIPLGERVIRPPKDRVAVFEVIEEDAAQLTNPGLK